MKLQCRYPRLQPWNSVADATVLNLRGCTTFGLSKIVVMHLVQHIITNTWAHSEMSQRLAFAHQITMGKGGTVITNNPLLHRSIWQFRDWDEIAGVTQTKTIPVEGDLAGKWATFLMDTIINTFGYNLKLTDIQAAIELAQLDKLHDFITMRKSNSQKLYKHLKRYEKFLILPKWEDEADPCWFGFMVVIKDDCTFTRLDLVNFLEIFFAILRIRQ